MLIPLKHENMATRRWPVVTFALIAINIVVFLITHNAIEDGSPELNAAQSQIFAIAGSRTDLTLPADIQQMVSDHKKGDPEQWVKQQLATPGIPTDTPPKVQPSDDAPTAQRKLDRAVRQYEAAKSASITEKYGFNPAHPKPVTYLTASFLHDGWIQIIGDMWFLWLAGFVLEDVWGRSAYLIFYLAGGAVALQVSSFTNPGSTVPMLGASGAVAAMMGAFMARFPRLKIEMMWIFGMMKTYKFQAPAFGLLPLWVMMEVFYGTLFGSKSGVDHWAHVAGFMFGAAAGFVLSKTGLEQKVESKVAANMEWEADPELQRAEELANARLLPEAEAELREYLKKKPDSIDGLMHLREIEWRQEKVAGYFETTLTIFSLHVKRQEWELAMQAHEDFQKAGGQTLSKQAEFDLARVYESMESYEAAAQQYERFAGIYANDRQGLLAQLAAAKLYLKKLARPEDAMRLFSAAQHSPVPHLDLEAVIQAGMREASVPNASKGAAAGK